MWKGRMKYTCWRKSDSLSSMGSLLIIRFSMSWFTSMFMLRIWQSAKDIFRDISKQIYFEKASWNRLMKSKEEFLEIYAAV